MKTTLKLLGVESGIRTCSGHERAGERANGLDCNLCARVGRQGRFRRRRVLAWHHHQGV